MSNREVSSRHGGKDRKIARAYVHDDSIISVAHGNAISSLESAANVVEKGLASDPADTKSTQTNR